ncbi:MAG: SAM-dependent methyltransferase [Chitinophagaceae bacterium]|nr:SAM-dependent methyltransferase [Chitinophagaceae bacterium]
MNKGVLHLIPNVLAEGKTAVLPSDIVEVVSRIQIFGVEEIRSARRLLKALNKQINIDVLQFHFVNEHSAEGLIALKEALARGEEIAYISEAGCPAIADPGQELVAIAHQFGAIVKPYVGPNSIVLALMASGFNGQCFQFLGYLPNKQPALSTRIKEIEKESRQKNCTQLFIETPYRNMQLLEELVKHGHPDTRLCIAADLTSEQETIISKSLQEWKKNTISFHKRPAVFVLYAISN